MSYCVNCGVELHPTARSCPLCQTPVVNPAQPVDTESPRPFPVNREEVPPVSRKELALLISIMLACVAVCCGVLNVFFLQVRVAWSLYVIGAAAMLWLWLVPPLVFRAMPAWIRICVGTLGIEGYLALIAYEWDGWAWYWGLAVPIVLAFGALLLSLWLIYSRKRSVLTSVTCIIGCAGVFLILIECFVDRWLQGRYDPGWSIIAAAVCVSLMIPLLVIRHRPSLRDQIRRRFHL